TTARTRLLVAEKEKGLGCKVKFEDLRALLEGKAELWPLLEEARRPKETYFGCRIETCAIANAKSGRCPFRL
ncbi:MAG: hypothetical protein Q9N34_03700, partial [Aquificota bacterium]|nr:hypothetical protein [Aquificota bacterium]